MRSLFAVLVPDIPVAVTVQTKRNEFIVSKVWSLLFKIPQYSKSILSIVRNSHRILNFTLSITLSLDGVLPPLSHVLIMCVAPCFCLEVIYHVPDTVVGDFFTDNHIPCRNPGPGPGPNSSAQLHCLIVDDVSSHRKMVANILTQLGHTWEFAEDGLGALAACDNSVSIQRPFDFVFMDLVMPSTRHRHRRRHHHRCCRLQQ